MKEKAAVWKKPVIIVALLGILALSAGASAQEPVLQVWHTFERNDAAALRDVAGMFQDETGVIVEVEAVEVPLLFERVLLAMEAGAGEPDVLVAASDAIGPLVDEGLIIPVGGRGDFFLAALLSDLPALVDEACGDTDVIDCLWPGASPALFIERPDSRAARRLEDWLCESTPYLPQCSGEALPGYSLAWGFTLLLLNGEWLAEHGLGLPVMVEEVLELRAEYGLDFAEVTPNRLLMAGDLRPETIVVLPSSLLAAEPEAALTVLTSFAEAGYIPVLSLWVDMALVAAPGEDPELADVLAETMARHMETKAGLFESSGRLLALSPGELFEWGLDRPESRATLQALVVLSTYAGLVF